MGNLSKKLETDELCSIFNYREQIHQQKPKVKGNGGNAVQMCSFATHLYVGSVWS